MADDTEIPPQPAPRLLWWLLQSEVRLRCCRQTFLQALLKKLIETALTEEAF